MTIIFNFCCLGAAIISLIDLARLYYHYRKAKLETIKNFSLGFLYIALAYSFLSLPQLILFNPFWIQIDFILVDIFFFGAVYFFILALLRLVGLFHLEKTFSIIIFSLILVYAFLNVLFFSSALPLESEGIIYYWISGTLWLQSISRGLMILLASVIILTFFLKGIKKGGEKIIFWRSFALVTGGALITIGGFIFWFSPWFYFSPFLLILSGGIGLLGFLIGSVMAIAFQPPRKKFVEKIT